MYLKCGYACINQTLKKSFRSFRLQSILDGDWGKIDEIICYNFKLLETIIKWNIDNNFHLFRMSSNIIPFLSDSRMMKYIQSTDMYNRLNLVDTINSIRDLVTSSRMRLTLHLIEYAHINSNSIYTMYDGYAELIQQYKLLKMLGGSTIIFHGGGLYGCNPVSQLERLHSRLYDIRNLVDLSMLAIENDDRTYTSNYVKDFAKSLGIGWCFDFHHYRCNPSYNIMETLMDYNPVKYHISTGVTSIYDRRHAYDIELLDCLKFLGLLMKCGIKDVDMMFESKGKELSVLNIMKPIGGGYWTLK